ncbi:TNF receptor-associated factor 6-like [Halichondria panicea]|uniref:TNF receptor-associated factor 6-like n=1 Tax=Halichondria panicea TaxID=6063 RepID=UPI00312BA76B
MSTSQETLNPTDLKSQSYSHRDGFEISFVEPPKELPLKCSICLELLTDPCILDCDCGSNFCKVCIEKVKKNHYPCPLCQQQFTTIFPNKQLQRTLNGLMIHCPHRAGGCSWMDELGKLKQHLNRMPSSETRLEGCGHTDVLCQYCKKYILRKDILTHETETCPKKPYTCQYCSHPSVLDDIRENHWLVCPQLPVPCPYECGERPQRQGLELHVNKKCLLAPVLCDFRYAGCEVELSRRDMANHLRDSIADHMTLMSLKHREEVSSLKEENQLVKQECADLKASFEAEVRLLKIESEQKMNNSLADVRKDCYISLQCNLDDRVEELVCQMDDLKAEIQSETSQAAASCVQPSLCRVPPVEIVVTNVKHLRQQRDNWTSEPFYSRGGYKMVLKVLPYGDQDGCGTHLSVYIYIIKGEYDHQLKWPFLGQVSITLVDQRLERHKTNVMAVTRENSDNIARRYNNTLTGGLGYPTFIEYKYLSPNYLKDDCLVFRIDDIKYMYNW